MKGASADYDRAVGLVYEDRAGETPCVSVKGQGTEAKDIIRIAQRFGVPIIENAGLVRSLSALEIDSAIPPSLFKAVAIVLSHLCDEPCDYSLSQCGKP